jgi:hypothetical protein
LPSKKLYPDYYLFIQRPICLSTIKGKLDQGLYATLDAFKDDLDLMFANAMSYNMEGSFIYQDALAMKVRLLVAVSHCNQAYVDKQIQSNYPHLYSKYASSQFGKDGTFSVFERNVDHRSCAEVKQLFKAIEFNDVQNVERLAAIEGFRANCMADCEMYKTKFKWGPIHAAAFYGRSKIIPILMRHGADVEMADKWYGGTPLAWAAFGDQVKTAKMLIDEYGANPKAKNQRGQIPFDVVSTPNNPEWYGLLKEVRRIIS